MKHRIAKIKISYEEIDTDNKTNAELIMPVCAANKVISFAFDWKENWGGSVDDVESLLESIKDAAKLEARNE